MDGISGRGVVRVAGGMMRLRLNRFIVNREHDPGAAEVVGVTISTHYSGRQVVHTLPMLPASKGETVTVDRVIAIHPEESEPYTHYELYLLERDRGKKAPGAEPRKSSGAAKKLAGAVATATGLPFGGLGLAAIGDVVGMIRRSDVLLFASGFIYADMFAGEIVCRGPKRGPSADAWLAVG